MLEKDKFPLHSAPDRMCMCATYKIWTRIDPLLLDERFSKILTKCETAAVADDKEEEEEEAAPAVAGTEIKESTEEKRSHFPLTESKIVQVSAVE